MFDRKSAFLCAASFLPVSLARASDAHFDTFMEGGFATTISDGGITFFDFDAGFGTPPNSFCIERADGDLAGMPGFSSPMTLGFSGYSPGTGAAYSRCVQFKFTTGQIESLARLEMFEFPSYGGNTITMEALLAGNVVDTHTIVIPNVFVVQHHTFEVSAPAFDTVRVFGGGPQDGGAFFALVDDVHFGPSPIGAIFCAGDGSATACPCGNSSPVGAGAGCLSSLGVGGTLRASGVASISADSVTLEGEQMPNAPALYYQGTAQFAGGLGGAFGDGLRCVGGTVVRLGTKTNVNGESQYPAPGDASVSVRGLVTSPGTREYQCWYRNAATFCTVGTFNLSNGLTLTWAP
jgi:hypothetical protein